MNASRDALTHARQVALSGLRAGAVLGQQRTGHRVSALMQVFPQWPELGRRAGEPMQAQDARVAAFAPSKLEWRLRCSGVCLCCHCFAPHRQTASPNYTTLTRETGIAECPASGRMRFSAVSDVDRTSAPPARTPPLGWAAMRRRSGMDFCAMKRLAVNASCALGPFADQSNCMSLFTSDDSGLSGGVAIGSPKVCPHHQRRPYAFLSFMATYNHARQSPWLLDERTYHEDDFQWQTYLTR